MIIKKQIILIISAVAIAFNAESKEMTIDILAGNWTCTPIFEQFGDVNHDLSGLNYTDVSKEESIGENKWSYVKVDNQNMKIIELDAPDPFLDNIVIPFKAKSNFPDRTDDGVTTTFSEYEYINDDEMITTNNYEELHYDENKKLKDGSFGYKYRNKCLRIK